MVDLVVSCYNVNKNLLYSLKCQPARLIHEFTYSLFIGLCLLTSDMTDYSNSYHSIKLIHCGAPQRGVLSDKVVTHIFCFMLCQSYLLSAVISFVYKDKLWFDESMSVIFCMEMFVCNEKNSFIPSPHEFFIELNLKTLSCN